MTEIGSKISTYESVAAKIIASRDREETEEKLWWKEDRWETLERRLLGNF